MRRVIGLLLSMLSLSATAAACGDSDAAITVYSGRTEDLIAPLIARFEQETGIDVAVRYGDSGELAATILEEGTNSPADVFFSQDPASIGSVAMAGLLAPLPESTLSRVPEPFSDRAGRWVGISGRARVVVYDSTVLDPASLPDTEEGFTDPSWSGRVAIAPTNGSFLAFVAAKILVDGEAETLSWLQAMAANQARTYSRNSVIVAAVDDGEVDLGLVNHYYLFRRIAEENDVVVSNYFMPGGGAASLVMTSGAGILSGTDQSGPAQQFIDFLLTVDSQLFFAEETFEYPLVPGIGAHPDLPPLEALITPDIDLTDLASVFGLATDLVSEAGLL